MEGQADYPEIESCEDTKAIRTVAGHSNMSSRSTPPQRQRHIIQSRTFTQYCLDTGIRREITSKNTPQQNGGSERDGRTLTEMAQCLLSDGGFPKSLGGGEFFTAALLVNRAPHKALEKETTPISRLHDPSPVLCRVNPLGAPTDFTQKDTRDGPSCGDAMRPEGGSRSGGNSSSVWGIVIGKVLNEMCMTDSG